MATFSAVQRPHLLQAIEEYDRRGRDDFLGVYGFEPSVDFVLTYEGRSYDTRAVLGVAHRYATGRLATAEEFSGGLSAAAALLRKRGFEVSEPPSTSRPSRPRSTTPRRPSTRKPAVPERVAPVCPTCSMTLPATGICDTCS